MNRLTGQTPEPLSVRLRAETGKLLALATPLIFTNIFIAGMGTADTIMAGRISADDLAAIALGSSGIWMPVFLFGMGILLAISPTVAHLYGAGHMRDIGKEVRQGFWLSQVVSWPLFFLARNTEGFLLFIGIEPEIVSLTDGYLEAIAWGLPFIYAYFVLRYVSEGIGFTKPIMLMAFIGFSVNVVGNYVLMFGKLGFPAMGAVGCGWASAITMIVLFFSMTVFVGRHRRYRIHRLFEKFDWPDPARLKKLVALGLPIGIGILAEAGVFGGTALLMGTISSTAAAAHQIAISYASTMFMIPLGLAMAITIRVGQETGASRPREARFAGFAGTVICGLFMVLSAAVMLVFGKQIVAIYTNDASVGALAASLLGMAALFQVVDGVQVGGNGALRGLKDTKIPMYINIFSYWVIGFSLAWYLGIGRGLGPVFVWVGLVASLFVAAILLNVRFHRISKRAIAAVPG